MLSLGLRVYRIKVVDVMNEMNTLITGLENFFVENYGIEMTGSVEHEKPSRPADTPPKEGN